MTALFLLLTFGISALGFALVRVIPAAQSPDRAAALPCWLLMVWGPSLAACILALRQGNLSAFLVRGFTVSGVQPLAWGLVLLPLSLLVLLAWNRPRDWILPGPQAMMGMVMFNLILGPLGEELGWRATLQEAWQTELGWLGASLAVGGIWTLWHLPLWLIPSPQRDIPLPLFAAHCMIYSVLIGAAYALSGGSVLPAILLHLTVNLAANLAPCFGFTEAAQWFRASLLPYLALTLALMALLTLTGVLPPAATG